MSKEYAGEKPITPPGTTAWAVSDFLESWLGQEGKEIYEASIMEELQESEEYDLAIDARCEKAIAATSAYLVVEDGKAGFDVYAGDTCYERRFFPLDAMVIDAACVNTETTPEQLRIMSAHLHDAAKAIDVAIEQLEKGTV